MNLNSVHWPSQSHAMGRNQRGPSQLHYFGHVRWNFLLNVLLRFYECKGNRREKVVEMLCTIGWSVLIGGITP
jgi:hypothetical protein